MLGRGTKEAYKRFADAARVVMLGDRAKQLELRDTLRRDARVHGDSMNEKALAEQIEMLAVMLRTSVVQAQYNEHTESHSVRVRDVMLKKDGSITQLEILTAEEVIDKLEGRSAENVFEAAIGCKSKTQSANK